jgi:hypothetical protein
MFANQINHAIPDRRAPHDVRESRRGWVGLVAIASAWDEPMQPSIAHCSQLASPGEAGAPATRRRGVAWGRMFANQINHAIPDRRAPHDVRESRLGVGWPCRNRVCLGRADAAEYRSLLSTCVPGRSWRVGGGGDPGSLGIDFRKPNQPRDPGSPCSARRPGKQGAISRIYT